MRQRDRARLHAAHRESGHRAMRLTGNGAEVRVHERNEVVDQCLLKRAEVEVAETAASAWTGSSVRRASSRSGICSSLPASEGIAAKFHGNDERLRFSLGDQIIHDRSGVALPPPAGFIFTRAVLEIEHGITL